VSGDASSLGRGGLVEGGPQLLGGLPGHGDFVVTFVGVDGSLEPVALPVGEVFAAAAQDGSDPVQRVAGVAAVANCLLLDPAADLVEGLAAELHNVKPSTTAIASWSWSSMAFL